jgi:hypothetical protein
MASSATLEARPVTFDREKFKRLVHYVVWKAGERPGVGATKLNRVLWFSEVRTYTLTGKPITGATYIREKFGPVPKQFVPIRQELEREGKIKVTKPRNEYDQTKLRALAPPDQAFLTDQERQTVDYWIRHIDEGHTAASMSGQSHDYPWEIAQMGEEIPLHASFAARVREPVGDEWEWAKQVAEKLKLP